MTHLKGFDSEKFNGCFSSASIATIEKIPAPFLHINHLIDEKKKLNRDKGQSEVIALEKIREKRTSGK